MLTFGNRKFMSEEAKKVLIVDDEDDIREAMAEALSQSGYQVLTAANGKLGFESAIKNKPDLILLDLMMPAMTGHEVMKKLRQDPWGQKAKVIVLSSKDDVVNIAGSHEEKIDDYIIKSNASLSEIVNKVRMAIYS